ncbi:hypothetical protein DSECCO2_349890 [anaerobic digester metagenome]
MRISSRLWDVTRTGTVISIAIESGTPTSVTERFGFGEMTVRAEKLTRFPESEPRNRPSLPFRRCDSVFKGRPERWRAGGQPATSLSR